MDTQVSPLPVDQSSDNDEEPSLRINEPEVGEEEDQFFDAGENAHNLSDITPTDLNFSVANEDLPTDDSDHSEQNSPSTAPQSKRKVEPILDNLDDISTEGPSSVDGNNSPGTGEALFDDDNEVPVGSMPAFSSESERNEDAVSKPPSNDAVHQYSTDDFSQDKAEKSSEDVPSQEDDVNVNSSSKSSMEVMDDESDSPSSKRSSPVEVAPNSDAPNKNSNADVVEANVENSTENGIEMISKNNAPLDSASTEKDEKVPETNEILSMDDSDVDESLQENLDVAIKVVEENQSSPVHTSTAEEHETFAKTDDCTNNDDSLKDTTSKSENILEEFQEDAAKINGDSSELLDSRLCSCQVVLFRIEFDEYALKYLKNKTETAPSSSDHNTDSSIDTSLSKAPDCDSNSESSFSKNPTKLSPPKRRVLTKAARKMIPSPESIKKRPSPRARNLRAATNSESTRPRRQARSATTQSSKYIHSKSSSSDDEAPLTRPNRKRKAVVNSTKRSVRTVRKPSYPQRTASRRSVREKVENFEKQSFIGLSGDKTLKCVSIPIITDLIDSLKEKSCSELIALIEQKEDKLPSQITKSKSKRNATVERRSRRRKLSPSDTSKSSVEDDDYKTYGKMWRYDDGTSREENNFSLRSEAKSTSSKRSSRKSAEVRNYVEDSGFDDEIPLKKAKTRSRGNLTRVKRGEKKDTSGDDEKAKDLPKAKSASNRRSPRKGAEVKKYVEDSKSDVESPLMKERTSRQNSTHDTNSDDEKAEDSSKAKSTSNKRLSRRSGKVPNYVEDSKSDDEFPMQKGRTSRENPIHAEGNEKNSTDSDDKEAEDSPKAKTTSRKRSSRKSAKVLQYVEDSISDDESPFKKKNTSRENSTHVEHNEKNDTDSDDEKVEVSSKGKSTSNKRSSRQSTKVPKYFEDSESDDESPLKKEMTDRESSTHVTDSNDENTENSSKAKSTSNKRSSGKSAEVLNYVEDFISDAESPLNKERTSRKNSTNAEPNEKNDTDSHDEETEGLPKAKSTSNKRSSRQSVKVPKYVEDSESDDESQLKKERTSRKNSTHVTDSDDEKAEDSPKVKSTSNKRSSKTTAKAPNYLDDSDSDEFPLKEWSTSGENSTHLVGNEKNDTDSDDGSAEDSSSETDNRSSRRRKGSSSSRTRA